MKAFSLVPLCLVALLCATEAHADGGSYATADVNLRAGPSTLDRVLTTVRGGDGMTVYTCLQTRPWCDVDWRGVRGWVSSHHIAAEPPVYAAPRYAEPEPAIRYADVPAWRTGVVLDERPDDGGGRDGDVDRPDWRGGGRDGHRYERRERRVETRWERTERWERETPRREKKHERRSDRRKDEYRKELRKLTKAYERKIQRLERKWR